VVFTVLFLFAEAQMIDTTTERLVTLAEAAKLVPGRPIHISTIHRWRLKGVRGIRLDTVMRGGIRFTSRDALERFFAESTAAADGLPTTVRTCAARAKAIAAAKKELAEAGI